MDFPLQNSLVQRGWRDHTDKVCTVEITYNMSGLVAHLFTGEARVQCSKAARNSGMIHPNGSLVSSAGRGCRQASRAQHHPARVEDRAPHSAHQSAQKAAICALVYRRHMCV